MARAGGVARDRGVLVPGSVLASALPASSRKRGGGLPGFVLDALDRAGGVVCDIVIPVPGSAPCMYVFIIGGTLKNRIRMYMMAIKLEKKDNTNREYT